MQTCMRGYHRSCTKFIRHRSRRTDKSIAKGSSETTDRVIAAAVFQVEAYTRNVESFLRGPGFWKGEKRWLPHDTPLSLYWQYLAFMKTRATDSPASWSTFFRVFKKLWNTKLAFRQGGGSQHAVCDVCVGLKRDIKLSRSTSERQTLLQRYMKHVFAQWSDRMVYWSLCCLSVTWCSEALAAGTRLLRWSIGSSMITIIIDGVDQAKFRIPRVDVQGLEQPEARESTGCVTIACVCVCGRGNGGYSNPGNTAAIGTRRGRMMLELLGWISWHVELPSDEHRPSCRGY